VHVDDLLRTKNFTAEASDAVLAEFYDREAERRVQTRDDARCRHGFHVNDIGRADDVAYPAAGAFIDLNTFDHALLYQLLARDGFEIYRSHSLLPFWRL
jgi:hypothetical protein